MSKQLSTTFKATLFIGLFLLLLSHNVLAASRYDVVYLWTGSVENAKRHKKKIIRLLGGNAVKKIRIVKKGKRYGVIYHKAGSMGQARRIIRQHSRILKALRVTKTKPIRSKKWQFIDAVPGSRKSRVARYSKPLPKLPAIEEDIKTIENSPDIKDLKLAEAVDSYVGKLRKKGLVAADERIAWSVYDFVTGKKLLSINEELQLQTASMIKPLVAQAYFHEVGKGRQQYDQTTKLHMRSMIQRSSNPSTNWIMKKLGGPLSVQALLKVNYPDIFRSIHFVEYIPASGRTYRNKAAAGDYSRFLLALWNNKLPQSDELKRLMSLPGSDRLYTGSKYVPRGTRVFNKTGSTAHLCGDMGILVVKDKQGREFAYTMIGIIEKEKTAGYYGRWIKIRGEVIRRVSSIVYRGVMHYHNKLIL